MPESLPRKEWIPGLDLLRCTAVFLVLIGHAKLLLPNASREVFRQYFPMPAAWGVELFFSLSGFLIGQQWVAINLSSIKSGATTTAWRFIRNRWVRTIPTYWLTLSILILAGMINIEKDSILPELIINLTLTNWISGLNYALPVSWTLAIEEFSYILIGASTLATVPLMKSIKPHVRRKWLTLFPIILISLGTLIRFTTWQSGHLYSLSDNPLIRLDALAYGLMLACFIDRQNIATISAKCWQKLWPPISLIASLLVVQQWRISLLTNTNQTSTSEEIALGIILPPAIGVVTSLWLILTSSWLSSGFKYLDLGIRHLAQISYSVYLVHIPLRTFFMRNWEANTNQEAVLIFFIYLILSILLGNCAYHILEKPFLSLKRHISNI